MEDLVGIVLAAGEGKRMKSDLPKVLHNLCGRPMVFYVLDVLRTLGVTRLIVVVGHKGEMVKERLSREYDGLEFVFQSPQLGTGDAVRLCQRTLSGFSGDILLICGDTPLVKKETLFGLIKEHKSKGAGVTILTAVVESPKGYGRIKRRGDQIVGIVEDGDATSGERSINEINTGIYCFRSEDLFRSLKVIDTKNIQGEYYLTDVIEVLCNEGIKVLSVKAKDTDEILGINDRVQLAWAHHRLNQNKIEALMISGVTILDPHTTFVSQEVEIGQDTIIFPFSWLEGKTSIGKRCIIGPQVFIEDTTIRDKTRVFFSFVSGSIIDEGSQIGPFSHLRRDTRIGREVKIGNFVETKKSSVADQSKVCHLSYIGDAELGRHVNVGAGTITCNYDGVKKHKTSICDNVFVGSNTALVAPVTIGEGSVIGAGSTITNDVPAASLGIARSRQKNIEGWVLRRKKDS